MSRCPSFCLYDINYYEKYILLLSLLLQLPMRPNVHIDLLQKNLIFYILVFEMEKTGSLVGNMNQFMMINNSTILRITFVTNVCQGTIKTGSLHIVHSMDGIYQYRNVQVKNKNISYHLHCIATGIL